MATRLADEEERNTAVGEEKKKLNQTIIDLEEQYVKYPLFLALFLSYTKLRVIRIQWELNIIQIKQKFGILGEKCIGFDQFNQKICWDYAIIQITFKL